MLSAQEFDELYIKSWTKTSLIRIDDVFFKCEHENPTGSIKSRGLSLQVEGLLKKGYRKAVISSSGNAALAAAYYCNKAQIELIAFVPMTIDPHKLKLMQSYGAFVTKTQQAIEDAEREARMSNTPLIRQSADPVAPLGFSGLADELVAQLNEQKIAPKDVSIFFPVSSGTTLAGWYRRMRDTYKQEMIPQVHAVQTAAVRTIVEQYDPSVKRKARSIVPGIVARDEENTYKAEVLEAIDKTGGSGWVVTDEAVQQAKSWLQTHGIDSSLEGALALAGYWRAKEHSYEMRGSIVVVLT